MPSNSKIGICPKCGFNLEESVLDSYKSTTEDSRIIQDWSYLLDSTNSKFLRINILTIEQSLAIRLLYIVQSYNNQLSKSENTMLSSIMQIARNTKCKQTFIHLSSILHFIRKFSVSLQEYLSLEVPKEFIDTILENKTRIIDNYTCIAPWCNHYKVSGSLERTPTSVKVLKSGSKQKYYMYCNDCGTEYSISENDNKLIERRNFISFAWYTVKNELTENFKLKELSRNIKVPEDKLRRAIIFLATNNLVNRDVIPITLPHSYDHIIIEEIKWYIEMGTPAKSIKQKLNLNYNDFLFYWLSREIRLANIKSVRKRPAKFDSTDERTRLFENAINQLVTENIPITIHSVCKKLNIAPETLRYWGLLNKLKEYKALQRKNIDKQFEDNIIYKTDEILYNSLSRNEKISSENLYKMIGVKRNVLVRRFPHLTQFINSKLLATNKLLH